MVHRSVPPSGPKGIIKSDVLKYIKERNLQPASLKADPIPEKTTTKQEKKSEKVHSSKK